MICDNPFFYPGYETDERCSLGRSAVPPPVAQVYPHVEGAYQAQKCGFEEDKEKYARAVNQVMEKRIGKHEKVDAAELAERSPEIMRELLVIKFSDPVLREKLRATGKAKITEDNRWHEKKW